jgi:CopG-like RHH_1 or ribbon-helix-helix domain, RHH_5
LTYEVNSQLPKLPAKNLKRITSYLPPNTHKVLEDWAEEEGRTVSNLVNRIVLQAVDTYLVQKSKKNESSQDNPDRT